MITTQKELNKVCRRLEKRLEYLESRLIDLGDYTRYRQKKSMILLDEYTQIQDTIARLCSEFRRLNQK